MVVAQPWECATDTDSEESAPSSISRNEMLEKLPLTIFALFIPIRLSRLFNSLRPQRHHNGVGCWWRWSSMHRKVERKQQQQHESGTLMTADQFYFYLLAFRCVGLIARPG